MSYCRIAVSDQALNYRSNESILNAISMREACVVWRMSVKIKSDATAAELGRLPPGMTGFEDAFGGRLRNQRGLGGRLTRFVLAGANPAFSR